AHAIESFGQLVKELAAGGGSPMPQAQEGRSYFGRHARPAAACAIDWQAPAAEIAALVRALDFGPRYPNTLGAATLLAGDRAFVVAAAEARSEGDGAAPGTLLALDEQSFSLACGEGSLLVTQLREPDGSAVAAGTALTRVGLAAGAVLPLLAAEARA